MVEGPAENEWQGLRLVFLFALLFAAAFYFGGMQHLHSLDRAKPVAYTRTEDYRSGFARGWDASLADSRLGRSFSPETTFQKFAIRAENYTGDYANYRQGFADGYEDRGKMDHSPNAPRNPTTVAK